MHIATKLIHGSQQPDEQTGCLAPPLFQTSTFQQDRPGCDRGFEYTRTNNPNRQQLESVLADLEGVRHAAVFSTGLAAEHAVLQAHLSPGDEIVLPLDVYGGTYRLAAEVFERQGCRVSQRDFADPERLAESLSPQTKLVWLETPTNPRLQIYDIEALAGIAHANGALLVVDNTFATPLLQRPFELGADIVVHSVTKYLNGHYDVVQGVALAKDERVFERVRFLQNAVGATPSPFDCWLSLRGLHTLELRLQKQVDNAFRIANYLESAPLVKATHYPGLTSHPGHRLAQRQMSAYGAMISIELDATPEAVSDFASTRRFFVLAESLGGVKSLICQPATMTHASIPEPTQRRMRIPKHLLRLSVGCENAEDLLEDLELGLHALRRGAHKETSYA